MGDEPMPVFVFGCLACGKTVAGSETSCPRCGASFEDVRFECPFCGELVSPNNRKCPSCGTEFSAFSESVSDTTAVDLDGMDVTICGDGDSSKTEAEEASYECPNCGKPVSEKDSECPHCGVRFG